MDAPNQVRPGPQDQNQEETVRGLTNALEQERTLTHALFDKTSCLVIIVDPNGVVLRINKACEEITGFNREELVGRPFYDVLVPKDSRQLAVLAFKRLVDSKDTTHTEEPWRRKDGSLCMLNGSSSVICKPNGEVDYVIGIGIDVTKERAAEAALRMSQERFELAAEGSQDGIWDVNMLTGERYYSPSWKEIIGYEDHQLPNTKGTWMDRIHPDDLIKIRAYEEGYKLRPNAKHELEFRMRHKDGSWRWILSRGSAQYDDHGNVIRVAGSHKDITEHKIQQEELLESQAKLLEAQDIANLGTWELDWASNKIWWNAQTYKIYGIDPAKDPLTMEELLATVHPEDRGRIRASIDRAIITGEPYKAKRRIFRPDGELRYVVTTARILRDSDGNPKRVVGVVQDYTEQQTAEDTINRAKEQALEASRLKSEFLANMSHEIRTPMNGVIGMAEALLDTKLDREQREHAQTIRDSADGLMSILNDILDFSKIEAGKMDLEEVPVDVLRIVEEVATGSALAATDKDITVGIDAEWSLPAAYIGDPTRVRQILTNLATNAVKFTQHGSVTIGLRTSAEGVHLWVQDTGIGISEERQKAVFESFTQADGTYTRRFGGTGLGLAIVKQLAELMHGNVALTSTLGEGSKFDVFLPLEAVSTPSVESHLKGHRVLFVSSSEVRVQSAVRFFSELGAQLRVASGVEELASALREGEFQSVIVDDRTVDRDRWGDIQSALAEKKLNLVLLASPVATAPPGFDATLSLPFTRQPVQTTLLHESSKDSSESQASGPMFTGMRVLLAEDNFVNQAVAEHQLERLGFQIDTAMTGREAVDLALKNNYDLILMDVQMPEMDGLTATEEIRGRQDPNNASIILAITAHAMQGDRERCIDAGMDDYISKPVRPQELRDKLALWLSPASREASKLNWDYLHEMSNNDSEFEKQILNVYLQTMPPLMSQLGEAIRTQNHPASSRVAHALMGSSRSIGANQFADVLQEVESLAETGQPYRHVDRLERQFEELVGECQRFISG